MEVLWGDSVHRLARGPEGEGGSRPLLPGTLPELWAQLHQHVLEQGESATCQLFTGFTLYWGGFVIFCPRLAVENVLNEQDSEDVTNNKRRIQKKENEREKQTQ